MNIQQFNLSNIKERIKEERNERLSRQQQVLPTQTIQNLQKLRNIGVIAHIDAGKTTLTERILYFAGVLDQTGEVHKGTTVMDYLQQEKERQITIKSAAISFNWKEFQINLIDTPGHIDFQGEVERCLRVIDSAVTVICSVKGVEAQSQTVWLQSNNYKMPRLVFLNKMDKNGSNFQTAVQSIEKILNSKTLILQLPIGEASEFKGVIDLINLEEIKFLDQNGKNFEKKKIDFNYQNYTEIIKEREKLISNLSLFDSEIEELFLYNKQISIEKLQQSIKKVLFQNSNQVCAVLMGSALKNKGIQQLIDAVIQYLPSPSEKNPIVNILDESMIRQPKKQEQLTALVFKIIQHQNLGALTYLRLFSGQLYSQQHLKNVGKFQIENIQLIYRVRADEYISISEVSSGDICAVSGLNFSQSGDTLLDANDNDQFLLEDIEMPQSVFMQSLQYDTQKDEQKFKNAIQILCREDNTLKYIQNLETNQYILSGLGELHLQIVQEKLEKEFNIKCKLGKVQVSYKESITKQQKLKYAFQKVLNNETPLFFELELEIQPLNFNHNTEKNQEKDIQNNNYQNFLYDDQSNKIEFLFKKSNQFDSMYQEFKRRKLVEEREITPLKEIIQSQQQEMLQQLKNNKKISKLSSSSQQQQSEIEKEDDSEKENDNFIQYKDQTYIKNTNKLHVIGKLEDEFGRENLYNINNISLDFFYVLENTILLSLQRGHLKGFPMIGVKVNILDGSFSIKRTDKVAIQMCAQEMMKQLILKSNPIILEPVMQINISTPLNKSSDFMNDILQNRRGQIDELKQELDIFGRQIIDRNEIQAIVPLIETVGYSTYIRKHSKGEAFFKQEFQGYKQVGQLVQELIIKNQLD